MNIGLSILIPVYNWDVNDFVQELYKQAMALNISFEILVFNDASNLTFCTDFEELEYVKYRHLTENIGRSRIRNLLAKEANYDKLLFLDGDSYPKNNQFLKNYWFSRMVEKTIICGGTAYKDLKPNEKPSLRWTYGKSREEKLNDKKGFASNNFMMYKHDFLDIMFNENILGYGHEDTLFGIHCKQKGYRFEKCHSPLLHLGLEPDNVFISKSKEAVVNLKKLYLEGKIGPEDSRLIAFHEQLNYKHLLKGLLYPFIFVLLFMVKKQHNLKAFDILKWYWFSS